MSKKDKLRSIKDKIIKAFDDFSTIVLIALWVIIAIMGFVLFLNCILGGPFIPLKYSFKNRVELIGIFIIHWGIIGIIFPIISIWRIYKLTSK